MLDFFYGKHKQKGLQSRKFAEIGIFGPFQSSKNDILSELSKNFESFMKLKNFIIFLVRLKSELRNP